MGKVAHYQNLIKQHLIEWSEFMQSQPAPNEEIVLSLDSERHQYILLTDQWLKEGQGGRSRHITLHVAIKNGKIWVQEDWTEEGMVTFLLKQGVPNEDIVLGFQPPWLRQHTEFAEA